MSIDPTFDQLWSEAVDKYMVDTKRSPGEKSKILQFHKLDDLVDDIRKESDKFSGFRHKREKFISVVKKIVRPFTVLSDVAATAVSLTPFAPAATIFGAVVFLIKAAGGVSDCYDWIEELFDKLGGFTERLDEYFKGGITVHLREKILAVLVCLLQIVACAETFVKDGRIKKYTAVLFLGQDDKVKASFDRLAKLFDDEQRLVQAISYATNRRIEEKTDEIDKNSKQTLEVTEEVQKMVEDLAISARSTENKALLDDNLLTPAYKKTSKIYNEYAESTIKNTGGWLFDDESVKRWIQGGLPLLWVFGGPGTGKSCLSSTLVTILREKYPQDPMHPNRTSVVYFYVKEYDEDLRDLLAILKSLAYEIAQSDPIFRSFAIRVLSNPDSVATSHLLWKNLFLGFYGQDREIPNSALIVVDGLDEAPRQTQKDFFSLLEELTDISKFGNRFSWALFSRPEVSEFLDSKFNKIVSKLEIGNKNESDIAQYIKQRVIDVLVVKQTMKHIDKKAAAKLARDIREKVLGKADGMFFKVVLIMDAIIDKERVMAVYASIDEAPPKLEEMIAHVFDKLMLNEDINKGDLNEILLWVSFVKQEMSIAQLYAVLKRRTGQAYDALEARLRGKFASIFKLSGGNMLSSQQMAGPETPQNGLTVESNISNEDNDADFDIDAFSEGEDEDASDKVIVESIAQKKSATQDSYELNKETIERFMKTTVRFTHASIRDFLTQSHTYKLDSHTGSIPIHVDVRLADVYIADACMQRIIEYGTNYGDPILKPDFIDYSCSTWSNHLTSASTADLTDAEKAGVVKTLITLFSDPTALVGFIKSMMDCKYATRMLYLFENPTTAALIKTKWLPAAKREDVTSKQWEWIQKSLHSTKSFFEPLGHAAAKLWLTKRGPDDPDLDEKANDRYYCWIAWAWLKLDDTKTDAEEIYIHEWLRDRYPECDSVIYDQILETFDVEKTQYYYAALGWFLVTSFPVDMDDKKLADQRNRAKETFQQALEIDPHYWLALQGFGWSLLPAPSLDKTSLLYEEALENCPKSLKQTRLLLKGSIIGFLMSGKDYETAAKSCAEDYISKPEEFNAGQVRLIGKYLRSCFALGEDDRVHNIVLDILRPAKADALLSLLELNGEHYIIGNTLWKNGEVVKIIQPLLDMFFESDQSMSAKNSPWMVIPCVRLINDYYPSADTVLKILELIAAPKFSADLSVELRSNFEIGRKEIERYLAGIYNDKAHEAHRAGKDPKEWVDKLRVLATAAKRNNGQAPTYLISSVSLLLGECLRENGATEQEWKACIRPTMMQGIDLLCDDDLFNDFDAYEMLVNALTAAGDVHNAIAAQVPCTMGLVYPDIKDKLSKLGYPKTWFGCSGTCWLDDLRAKPKDSGFEYDTFREMWRCMQCFNVQFCEKFVEVAKAGQTPKRICGKDHPLIKFCPPPDDLKTRVVNWNAENETVDVNKEWLEGLRKEWS